MNSEILTPEYINNCKDLNNLPRDEWRDIKKYEGLYMVSNLGRVKSLSKYIPTKLGNKKYIEGRILSPMKNGGYLNVRLYDGLGKYKNWSVHKLVGIIFIKNIENKPIIHHKNYNKYDNMVKNLEWKTYSENTQDAYDNNRIDISNIKPKKELKKYILELPNNYFSLLDFKNEIWKDIPNYEGLYHVSNMGRIKCLTHIVNFKTSQRRLEHIHKPSLLKNGYCAIILSQNAKTEHFLIHRLVAISFLQNDNKFLYVNHKNSNRQDNRVENLEWCTQKQNVQHGIKYGFFKTTWNENNYKAKLKNIDIPIIKECLNNGISYRKLANQYGVAISTIFRIKHGISWKNIV